MAKSGARKVVKPVAAAAVTAGTIASIWWFALKPRRKAKHAATSAAGAGAVRRTPSAAGPEPAAEVPETD